MWVRLTWPRYRSVLFAQWDNNYGFTPSPLPRFANWAHWGKLGCGVSGRTVSSKWRDDTRCLFPCSRRHCRWEILLLLPLTSYVAPGAIMGPANLPLQLPHCPTASRATEVQKHLARTQLYELPLLGVERFKSLLTKTHKWIGRIRHRWERVVWEVQNVKLKMKPKFISMPYAWAIILRHQTYKRHDYSDSLNFNYQHTHREIRRWGPQKRLGHEQVAQMRLAPFSQQRSHGQYCTCAKWRQPCNQRVESGHPAWSSVKFEI